MSRKLTAAERELYEAHYHIIRQIVIAGTYTEEHEASALEWSVQWWPEALASADGDAHLAAIFAARCGLKRQYQPFASTRSGGQVDALDSAEPIPVNLQSPALAEARQRLQEIIDRLPTVELQTIATMLASGSTQRDVADCLHNVVGGQKRSPAYVCRRVEQIREVMR